MDQIEFAKKKIDGMKTWNNLLLIFWSAQDEFVIEKKKKIKCTPEVGFQTIVFKNFFLEKKI